MRLRHARGNAVSPSFVEEDEEGQGALGQSGGSARVLSIDASAHSKIKFMCRVTPWWMCALVGEATIVGQACEQESRRAKGLLAAGLVATDQLSSCCALLSYAVLPL